MSFTQTEINIYCDGGARGNPGPAAIGVVAFNSQQERVYQLSQYLGWATNNVAEYQALIAALSWLSQNYHNQQYSAVVFYLDSKLIINQMLGKYKLKDPKLKELHRQAKLLEQKILPAFSPASKQPSLFPKPLSIDYYHIPREQNKLADSLVNQALDTHQNLN